MELRVILRKETYPTGPKTKIFCSIQDISGVDLGISINIFELIKGNNIVFDRWYPDKDNLIYINLAHFMGSGFLEILKRPFNSDAMRIFGAEESAYYLFELLFLKTNYITNTFIKSR